MSHIVTIRSEIRDLNAIRAACNRLDLDEPELGTFKLFSGEAEGMAVNLPDWVYPAVCDLRTGQLRFDNFGGRWGAQEELDRFRQAYAVEKAHIEARKRGHSVAEHSLPDGSIKLIVVVSGGAA